LPCDLSPPCLLPYWRFEKAIEQATANAFELEIKDYHLLSLRILLIFESCAALQTEVEKLFFIEILSPLRSNQHLAEPNLVIMCDMFGNVVRTFFA